MKSSVDASIYPSSLTWLPEVKGDASRLCVQKLQQVLNKYASNGEEGIQLLKEIGLRILRVQFPQIENWNKIATFVQVARKFPITLIRKY